jgi:hypothetical protein
MIFIILLYYEQFINYFINRYRRDVGRAGIFVITIISKLGDVRREDVVAHQAWRSHFDRISKFGNIKIIE